LIREKMVHHELDGGGFAGAVFSDEAGDVALRDFQMGDA